MVDVSIPYVITPASASWRPCSLLVPAALTVGQPRARPAGPLGDAVFGAGAAAFAIVALAFLFAASLLDAIGALRVVDQLSVEPVGSRGAYLWAVYGTFTLAAFALAEHALPRLCCGGHGAVESSPAPSCG